MTTTDRTSSLEQEPWTPFDSDFESIVVSSNGPTLAQTQELRDLHCLRDGYLECYRTLVTPLLAAMEKVATRLTDFSDNHYASELRTGMADILEAAIKLAKERDA